MTTKLSDYYIAQSYSKKELEDKVNDLIKCGYLPIGGIAVHQESVFNISYSQALIRHTSEKMVEDIIRSKN